ncbi:MAG: tyrosine-type recombinase/integrase, partial [Kovacikia sp.]
IETIKNNLADRPRDLCLFVLGINTAFRANELLSIRVGQVRDLKVGDVLDLRQSKTNEYRQVTLNRKAISVIQGLLGSRSYEPEEFLFFSRWGERLGVPEVSRKVKGWCQDIRLDGNYGSHSLRKTWGYWQYKRGTPIPLLMEAFGHQTQRQTMAYLGIQAMEVAQIFEMEL